jgi:hypothetical protein
MAYIGPGAGVENWIKISSTTASHYATSQSVTVTAKGVVVPVGAVALSSGTIITATNYSNDIRDFLVGTLDSVYKVYSALTAGATDTQIPSNFSVARVINSTSVQYLVTVNTNGDVDFPTLA